MANRRTDFSQIWDSRPNQILAGAIKGNYEELADHLFIELVKERNRCKFFKSLISHQRITGISGIMSSIRRIFEKIDEIKSIYIDYSNEIPQVIIITEDINEEIENKIYSAEYDLSNCLDSCKLDFILLPEQCEKEIQDKAQKIV